MVVWTVVSDVSSTWSERPIIVSTQMEDTFHGPFLSPAV